MPSLLLRENKFCIVASPASQLGSVLGKICSGPATRECMHCYRVGKMQDPSGVPRQHTRAIAPNKLHSITSYTAGAFGVKNCNSHSSLTPRIWAETRSNTTVAYMIHTTACRGPHRYDGTPQVSFLYDIMSSKSRRGVRDRSHTH